VILVDVSVIVRLACPEVADVLAPLAEAGTVATCAVIDLQLFAQLEDPNLLARVTALRSASFIWLPTDDTDLRTALATQAALLSIGEPMTWPNLVVAAVAQRHGATILHYDAHFDVIAKVTGQKADWVVPTGTVN
jgi:predicted nucleic acid-binding protein